MGTMTEDKDGNTQGSNMEIEIDFEVRSELTVGYERWCAIWSWVVAIL